MLQEIAEETFKHGAATFVGLELLNHRATWKVLGDSCLFILPDKGFPQCICSDSVKVSDDGKINISFGSHPAQIHSDGQVFGNFATGSDEMIEVGWYVLMSDAISEWFVNQLNEGNNMASALFNLNSNEEFEYLVEREYQANRMRSDDCTVLIIRIDRCKFDSMAMTEQEVFESMKKPENRTKTSTKEKEVWDDNPAPDYFTDVPYSDEQQAIPKIQRLFRRLKSAITFWKKNNDINIEAKNEELPE